MLGGNMGTRIEWPGLCGEVTDNRSHAGVFWDDDVTLNTYNPDLTECFQQTALLWTACGTLWACAVFYLPYIHRQPTRRKGWRSRSWLHHIKMISGLALIVLAVTQLIHILITSSESNYTVAVYIGSPLLVCTFVLATVICELEHRKDFHTSGVLLSFWLLSTILRVVPFRSLILKAQTQGITNRFQFGLFYAQYLFIVVLFVLHLMCDYGRESPESSDETAPLLGTGDQPKEDTYRDSREVSPEDRTSFIGSITHWWFTPLILKGYKMPLTFSKLHRLRTPDRCDNLMPTFYQQWNSSTSPNRSLAWPLIKATMVPLVISGIARMMVNIFALGGPIVLRELISFVTSRDQYVWKGYFLTAVLFVVKVVESLFAHISFKYSFLTAQRVRSILIAAVYKKALRLSHQSRKGTTTGQIVNLMAVDSQRIHDEVVSIHEIWGAPVLMALSLYLLWEIVGPASLAGLGVLLVLAPINGLVGARGYATQQVRQMKFKDIRIKLLNEILSGIKVLKFYAWEPSFMKKVRDIRDDELECVQKASMLSVLFGVTWIAAPYMVSLAVFATYILTKEDKILPPETAFVALNVINLLQFSVSYLPILVAFGAQAYTSLKRIHKMLNQEELDPDSVEVNYTTDAAVKIENGTFSWGEEDRVLQNVNMEVGQGKLVAIVGHVGCGKSSLLNAILGELKKEKGHVYRQGTTAYVPQQAWIQNMTLKDNVLFGKKTSESRYDEVIEACALKPDLEILPAGDKTEIGEKGINLSGGQKQRVNLARAVYQDCDIYLLDDVMSAVDAHVGKHIFRHVIGPTGLLKHKTRLLVTHGVSYLPEMDYIIAMKDGCIAESGTYQELLEQNGAFAEFIRNYLEETGDEEKDEEEIEIIKTLQRQLSRSSESDADIIKTLQRQLSRTSDSETEAGSIGNAKRRRRTSSTRRSHTLSENPPVKEAADMKKAQLIEEEQEELGNISARVIWAYVKSGGMPMFILMAVTTAIYTASMVSTNIWLRLWSDDQLTPNITDRAALTNLRLGVYGGLGVGQVAGISLLSTAIFLGGVYASRTLHSNLLERILRAPMSFFDTTPLGRIVNRFSTDMDRADNSIPPFVRAWMVSLAACLTTIIGIIYSIPIFTVALLPLGIFYVAVQRLYITAVRQMKRIDSVRRSPIYTHFDETLVGVTTVRAYRRQTDFASKNEHLVDNSQSAWYPILIGQRWLAFNMEVLGAFIVLIAALIVVIQKDSLTGGLAGLSISYSLDSTFNIYMLVRAASDLETNIVSVERIMEYSEIETEAARIVEGNRPSSNWPNEGSVKLANYSTRYRKDLDLVLKEISADIKPGEKVGIVGRTGAGKSSLTLSLFRIIEAAGGAITIDGINIAEIGLQDLRSKLTIIPQDPVLFSGSLRMNLDPFDKYTDDEIWTALDHAHLKSFVKSLSSGLQHECGEGGSSLSVGQRQLVCLARALLRKTRILVLDEATAAIDMETDDLIQATIRQEFSHCTVITIAHRINTVLDYDKIMVMADGHIVEYDAPNVLLSNEASIFHDMAKQVGLV